MDRFQAMQVFTRVVDANSFTKAAEHLGLPRATVTTIIQNLEALLQVRLLNRTTRRLSLTPDGAAYYEHCARILGEVEETESSFRDVARGPKGRLRIDVPSPIGRLILIPRLSEFHARYPEVELVIGMGDRMVDLVREAVDCVIRVGELQDSTLVARRIGALQLISCATPDYLERYGVPQGIDDLQHHVAVQYFSHRTGRNFDWDFIVDGQSVPVAMRGNVSVNDLGGLHAEPPPVGQGPCLCRLGGRAVRRLPPAWRRRSRQRRIQLQRQDRLQHVPHRNRLSEYRGADRLAATRPEPRPKNPH